MTTEIRRITRELRFDCFGAPADEATEEWVYQLRLTANEPCERHEVIADAMWVFRFDSLGRLCSVKQEH